VFAAVAADRHERSPAPNRPNRFANDASRDVASTATASALIAIVILLAASAAGAWWLHRRGFVHRPLAWFGALGSISGCFSLTFAREGAPEAFRPGNVFAWAGSGCDRLIDGDLLGSSQFLLNVALFVPAGLAWTWLTRRPAATLVGLAGLSMLIESLQAVVGLGGADITDVVASTTGAAVGVAAGGVVMRGIDRPGGSEHSPVDARRRGVVAAGFGFALVAVLVALLAGADRRQARIHEELENAFVDTSYDELAAVLQGDPDDPDRLDPDARFNDSEQIFSAVSVRADGFRYTDDQIELRWPAMFFGLRRCVYVIWTPSGSSSAICQVRRGTDFIG
jgi:VanZ like family